MAAYGKRAAPKSAKSAKKPKTHVMPDGRVMKGAKHKGKKK